MRKKNILKYWFIIALILGLLGGIANADDVDVDIIIQPAVTWPMNELYNAVEGSDDTWIKRIVSITLTNNTNKDQQLKLRVKLYSNKIDSTKPLIDYTTSYRNYEINVPANQTKIIDTKSSGMATGGILRSDRSEIRNKVTNAYGTNPLNYSGWIPEDTYRYEVMVFDKDDNELFEGDKLGYATETIYIPQHSTKITVVQPADRIVLMEKPIFRWQPLEARAGADFNYSIKLYEIDDFKQVDSSYGNPIFSDIVDSSVTQIQYSGPDLVLGQKYALKIIAKDQGGWLAENSIKEFQYGYIEAPSLNEDEQVVDTLPIILSWDADSNNDFRVVVSEDVDGTIIVLDEEVSNVSQFVLNDSQLINPGKTYYWYVELLIESSQQKIRSKSLGSFTINQNLAIIAPNNNEIIEDSEMISFFWQGNNASQYILKISYSDTMEKYKRYIVGGTRQDISIKELGLIRDMTHYWTVREIDDFGTQWGMQPTPGSFKLPKLKEPKLISPLNEIVSSEIVFAFNLLSWADYYRIDVFSTNDRLVFSKEVKSGYLKINLADIAEMVSGKKYSWTVTAISDELNESVVSEHGSFKFKRRKEKKLIDVVDRPEFLTPATIISWEPIIEDGVFYEIHISHEANFSNPKIITVTESKFSFKSIDKFKSDLFYKILAYDADRRVMTHSKVYKISISDIDVLYDPIVLIGPDNIVPKNVKAKFSWLPEIKDAKLIISTDKNLKKSTEFIISGDSISFDEIKYDFKIGVDYFWTVKKLNHPSKMIHQFKIVPSEIMLVQPIDAKVNLSNVLFQWVADADLTYKLILARDEFFKDIVDEIKVDALMLKYQLKDYGKLFWKVQQLDNDGNIIQDSSTSSIDYIESNDAIENNLRKNLEYFIKQNLDNDSKIKIDEWRLTDVKAVGRTKVTEDDIRDLLDNKVELIRVKE